MKKFKVLVVNRRKNEALVVTEIKAKSEKEARIEAASKYLMYVNFMVGEQLVVASDNRYNLYYRDMVEATDARMN